MESLYDRVKNATHKSPRLTAFLKKRRYIQSVWVVGKPGQTLQCLEKQGLNARKFVGVPVGGMASKYEGKKARKTTAISGAPIMNIITARREDGGLFSFKRGVWAIDVTEEFVAQYNLFGMCLLSDSRHEFRPVSPKIKQCEVCRARYRLKIEWVRNEEWNKIK